VSDLDNSGGMAQKKLAQGFSHGCVTAHTFC
jgi:hypothetical protein